MASNFSLTDGTASGGGLEQVGETDPVEQFRTNAIRNAVDDFGAILGLVDMNSKCRLPKGMSMTRAIASAEHHAASVVDHRI
jgi:hypothetical protein